MNSDGMREYNEMKALLEQALNTLEAFVSGVETGKTFHTVTGGTWHKAKLLANKIKSKEAINAMEVSR